MRFVKHIFMVSFSAILMSCANEIPIDKTDSNSNGIDIQSKENSPKESVVFNKLIHLYKFDNSYKDSALISTKWFLNDTLIKEDGQFLYELPIQSLCLNTKIIQDSRGKGVLEVFNSDAPEQKQKSAWNKYIFKYDESNRPQFVKHYIALIGKEDKDGKPITSKKLDYKLSETIYILYKKNESVQIVKNELGIQVEKLSKRFDRNSRLVSEEWVYGDDTRYRVYYTYKK
jgi:hypothetical protein